jgi:hypothetical protein
MRIRGWKSLDCSKTKEENSSFQQGQDTGQCPSSHQVDSLFFRHRTSGGGTQPVWFELFNKTTEHWDRKYQIYFCLFSSILGRGVCPKLLIPCREIILILICYLFAARLMPITKKHTAL